MGTHIDDAVAARDLAEFGRCANVNENTKRAAIYAAVNASWPEAIKVCQAFDANAWSQSLTNGCLYDRCKPEFTFSHCPEQYRAQCTANFAQVKKGGLSRQRNAQTFAQHQQDGTFEDDGTLFA